MDVPLIPLIAHLFTRRLASQDGLEHLLHGIAGQECPKFHQRWFLVTGHVALAVVNDLFLCGLLSRLQDDNGLDDFPPVGIGNADDGHLRHLGVVFEDGFDLHGIDILATPDDHVLLSPLQVEIAVFIHEGEIARMEPAAPQGFFRSGGVSPVALHDPSAPGHDFPHSPRRHFPVLVVEDANVHSRNFMADAGKAAGLARDLLLGALQLVVFLRAGRDGAHGFGHAKVVRIIRGEFSFRPKQKVEGHGRGTVTNEFQGGEIAPGKIGIVQNGPEHGGNDVGIADGLFFDGVEKEARLELSEIDQLLCPMQGDDGRVDAGDMVHGDIHEHGPQGGGGLGLFRKEGADVVIGQHGPFGAPRGAARIDQAGYVVLLHGGAGIGSVRSAGEEGLVLDHAGLRLADADALLKGRRIISNGLDHPGIAVADQKNFGAGVIQDISRLLAHKAKIQGDDDPPHFGDGVDHLHELVAVGLKDGHPVSQRDGHAGESVGQAGGPLLHLAVAQPNVSVDDARLLQIVFTVLFNR
jgi:hypothetical protein